MELDIHFMCEKVVSKSLQVLHALAHAQLDDFLTKPLSTAKFTELRSKLKVVHFQPPHDLGGEGYTNILHVIVNYPT